MGHNNVVSGHLISTSFRKLTVFQRTPRSWGVTLTNKTESEAFPPRSPLDHSDKSRQLAKSRFHQGSEVPRVASQRGGRS